MELFANVLHYVILVSQYLLRYMKCSSWKQCAWWLIKWKHFPRYWPFVRGIHRSPVKSPHKGQWRGALIFSLICVWICSWVNNREVGDLRRYRAHYDITVMDYHVRSRINFCCRVPSLDLAHSSTQIKVEDQEAPYRYLPDVRPFVSPQYSNVTRK